MNYKKFSKFVIIIGFVLLGFGLLSIMANQPKKYEQSKNEKNFFDSASNWADNNMENMNREEIRRAASKMCVYGVIILVIGGGIFYSAKS